MKIFRGYRLPPDAPPCALTIGNFDGVHRGHQAMLALLRNEARHRGLPSCAMTFEPHPRDFFAEQFQNPELAPARIATLRDKLCELSSNGIDQTVIVPFNAEFSSLPPEVFIRKVLVEGLRAQYVLVGDDFRFGAKRAGDYAMLDAMGRELGFEVARMNSYEVSRPLQPGEPAPAQPGIRIKPLPLGPACEICHSDHSAIAPSKARTAHQSPSRHPPSKLPPPPHDRCAHRPKAPGSLHQ